MPAPNRPRPAREHQRGFEDEERERRERLLSEVESIALDFFHSPEQIGYYLAERVRLRPGDRDRIVELLHSLGGDVLVARAFAAAGFIPAPDAMPAEATPEDWLAGDAFELYDAGRTASILEAIREEWGIAAREAAEDPRRCPDVPPPRHGTWADLHERKRRALIEDVRREWRIAAAPVEPRGARPDRTRAGLEPLSPRLSVGDPNPDRARRTADHVERLAPALGLDVVGVQIRVGEQADRRTAAKDADGLVEDGTVWLRSDVYDGESAESRSLIAHELAHLAQQRHTGEGADPGLALGRAEAEAELIGAVYAVGYLPARPQVPLTTPIAARPRQPRGQPAAQPQADPRFAAVLPPGLAPEWDHIVQLAAQLGTRIEVREDLEGPARFDFLRNVVAISPDLKQKLDRLLATRDEAERGQLRREVVSVLAHELTHLEQVKSIVVRARTPEDRLRMFETMRIRNVLTYEQFRSAMQRGEIRCQTVAEIVKLQLERAELIERYEVLGPDDLEKLLIVSDLDDASIQARAARAAQAWWEERAEDYNAKYRDVWNEINPNRPPGMATGPDM